MKAIFYKFTFRVILGIGIIVGIVKGQEARQRWVTKKKIKYETKRETKRNLKADGSQVVLDEIEMSTYHS